MSALYYLGRFGFRSIGALTRWEVRGREHVPLTGRLIVAANHVSFWDPPMVGSAVPRDTFFLAKEELFAGPLLGSLFRACHAIPIRRGSADLAGIKRAVELIQSEGALVVFPEGSRMKDGALHPARPGMGMMAVQADANIVPCFISASNRPSRWLTWRERLRIWFGPAKHWKEFAGQDIDHTPGRALYQKLGEAVMGEIATLRNTQQRAMN